MTSLEKLSLPEQPLDWHTNDALICPGIALAVECSTATVNAKDKLPGKQLFEELWWYTNDGSKGWNSISTVFLQLKWEQEM